MNVVSNKIVLAVVGIMFLGLLTIIGFQKAKISEQETTITILESNVENLTLSNDSLIKDRETSKLLSESKDRRLQECLDSQNILLEENKRVETLIRNATPTPIDKGKVIDDEKLKNLIDFSNAPLPRYGM